ncbi:MAG: glycosyltransferase [Bacillota bacterium]
MLVSIIIPCKNEGQNLDMTLESLHQCKVRAQHEIIVVDDGSTDGCCEGLSQRYPLVRFYRGSGLGAARARNFGASKAKGGIYVFCDAHMIFVPGWLDTLMFMLEHDKAGAAAPGIGVLGNPNQVGYGLTWDDRLRVRWLPRPPNEAMEVPLLPGGCLAVKKEVFKSIDGFDGGFKVWGHEDEEISLKLWLFGHVCCICPEVIVLHKFRSKHPYSVNFTHVSYNFMRMAISHFKLERISKLYCILRERTNYQKIADMLAASDVHLQREQYIQKRKYNDDWFFNKFEIPF